MKVGAPKITGKGSSMAKASLQKEIDNFIGWMGKVGMLARWESRRKMKEVAVNRRRLNAKIRFEKVVRETMAELEGEEL